MNWIQDRCFRKARCKKLLDDEISVLESAAGEKISLGQIISTFGDRQGCASYIVEKCKAIGNSAAEGNQNTGATAALCSMPASTSKDVPATSGNNAGTVAAHRTKQVAQPAQVPNGEPVTEPSTGLGSVESSNTGANKINRQRGPTIGQTQVLDGRTSVPGSRPQPKPKTAVVPGHQVNQPSPPKEKENTMPQNNKKKNKKKKNVGRPSQDRAQDNPDVSQSVRTPQSSSTTGQIDLINPKPMPRKKNQGGDPMSEANVPDTERSQKKPTHGVPGNNITPGRVFKEQNNIPFDPNSFKHLDPSKVLQSAESTLDRFGKSIQQAGPSDSESWAPPLTPPFPGAQGVMSGLGKTRWSLSKPGFMRIVP